MQQLAHTTVSTPPQGIWARLGRCISWLLFGSVEFGTSEEYQEFRYKLLIVLMVSGAVLTALLIVGTFSHINPIGNRHELSMVLFTSSAFVLWLLLRGHPGRFTTIAWVYEIVCLWEYTSALLYVPTDELRVLWFFVNIPGVFILLGPRAGWVITLGTVVGLVWGNTQLSQPYSANAMATGVLGMLYLGVTFHAYMHRSISYFTRMREYNAQLHQLASHDPLTGVFNARAYYAACDQHIRSGLRSNQPFAVLFVDLDHFKAVNDTYGHAAGDEVLRVVAHTLQQHIRRSDVLGRIGGEEFSVFLPDTPMSGAIQLAETLRVAVENCHPQAGDVTLKMTASIGVAARSAQHQSMQDIQRQADEAMYLAKKGGRNRVSALNALA